MGSGITIPGQVPNDGRIIGIPVRGMPTATLLQIQWNDTDKVFEFVAGGGGVSGDLAFLAKKEFEGNLVTAQGVLSVIGDLASITAAVGKDLYSAKAKITSYQISSLVAFGLKSITPLLFNGTVFEVGKIALIGNTSSGVGLQSQHYEYVNMGFKVGPTEIIKLEVTVLNAGVDTEGTLVCFVVDTGTDPTA